MISDAWKSLLLSDEKLATGAFTTPLSFGIVLGGAFFFLAPPAALRWLLLEFFLVGAGLFKLSRIVLRGVASSPPSTKAPLVFPGAKGAR